MVIHLRVQNPIRQRLLGLIEKAIRFEHRLRVCPIQKLIEDIIRDNWLFPACQGNRSPLLPLCTPTHEIPGSPLLRRLVVSIKCIKRSQNTAPFCQFTLFQTRRRTFWSIQYNKKYSSNFAARVTYSLQLKIWKISKHPSSPSLDAHAALAKRLLDAHSLFTVTRTGLDGGACLRVTPGYSSTPADMARLLGALRSV